MNESAVWLRGFADDQEGAYGADRLREIAAQIEALEAGLADLFAMIDEGLLVRDISADHDTNFHIQALRFVQRLAQAKQAIT